MAEVSVRTQSRRTFPKCTQLHQIMERKIPPTHRQMFPVTPQTGRAIFKPGSQDFFQYLGFNVSQTGAIIRPSSLSRLHRKAKRAIKTTKAKGREAIAKGEATYISTKRLRQRFWPTGARNFSKYARRAADEFGSKAILRQALRLERLVDLEIRDIEK